MRLRVSRPGGPSASDVPRGRKWNDNVSDVSPLASASAGRYMLRAMRAGDADKAYRHALVAFHYARQINAVDLARHLSHFTRGQER